MNNTYLFQQILHTLNTYAAHNNNTVTGQQRIALAKACEALYSGMEGQPALSLGVNVYASLNAPEKPSKSVANIEKEVSSKDTLDRDTPEHSFDAVHTIQSVLGSHIDKHTANIAN